MGSIQVPAERWEKIAEAYSTHIAVEHKGKKPIPVRSAEDGGFIYTVFSVSYGPWGTRQPSIEAWRLLPASMYTGDATTVYHDKAAIEAGLRERGDHTGLIVSANGKLMVCAERVRFLMGLPETRQLSLAQAKDHDERQRRSGWRALWFGGKEPEWFSLRGHPVAVYRDHDTLGDDHAVLLWKGNGQIHELSIANDVVLSPVEELTVPSVVATPEGQLALF